MTKCCNECKLEKDLESFSRSKGGKFGRRSKCKDCQSSYYKDYYAKDDEYHKNRAKVYYSEHTEERKSYASDYRVNNRESVNKANNIYQINKRQTDLNFRLACNLRTRLSQALKSDLKSGSAVDDLGCSIEFFKAHLESKFISEMNWDNKQYERCISYILLSEDEIKDRLVQITSPFCKECGHRLE